MERDRELLGLPLPNAGQRRAVWAGLHGAGTSLAVAEVLRRSAGPVCVVAPSAAAVEQLQRELAFFAAGVTCERFPDYETLPYEAISPPQDLLADRLSCLYRLASGTALRLLVNADALLNRLPPPDFVLSRSLALRRGQRVDRAALTAQLVEHGYLRVEQAAEQGEFAVRGALIDIYPTGAAEPIRVDFFDDEIETLRTFDAQSQLSHSEVDTIRVLPAREFPFDARSTAIFPMPSCPPASSTSCRCSSSAASRWPNTCPKTH